MRIAIKMIAATRWGGVGGRRDLRRLGHEVGARLASGFSCLKQMIRFPYLPIQATLLITSHRTLRCHQSAQPALHDAELVGLGSGAHSNLAFRRFRWVYGNTP